jgi:phosphoglycolate phosphatase-like HAD superfamily hydrolase
VKALVLDFDGVLSDSAPEAFQVALETWRDLNPQTRLGAEKPDALYDAFLEMMPLGNRAEDYAVELAALETGLLLPDQDAYDAFKAKRDSAGLRAFHKRFYQVRTDWARRDPDGWRALMRPYAPLLELLRRRAGDAELAIATSKDRASVQRLLEAYGVADLFPEARVLDKEAGADKRAHLTRLHRALGLAYPEMTFVDDKVNHLEPVAGLGVRCVLAAWGYNGPREHRRAQELGFPVCSLDAAEATLFA